MAKALVVEGDARPGRTARPRLRLHVHGSAGADDVLAMSLASLAGAARA